MTYSVLKVPLNPNQPTNQPSDSVVVAQVHLSFSLYGAENAGDKSPQLQWQFLRLFLQSVGIVLTDIQDVVFQYVLRLSRL